MNFNKKAFTLIELLVVVLIIGILAAIALPQYQKAVERTRFTKAKQTLSSLYQAAQRYELSIGSFPKRLEDLDITLSGESTDVPSNLSTVLTNSDKVKVDGFSYGILNVEDGWNHNPVQGVFAYNDKYSVFRGHNSTGFWGLCGMGSGGILEKKYCIDMMQGTRVAHLQSGLMAYTIP
jgi:type II secretion system protein G